MDWQQIMEQVLEINELQQQGLIKSQNLAIKEIVTRKQNYLENKTLNLNSLNNAILEHQLILTPYQITILSKINQLSLTTDPQSIYINMPESEEEAEKYVTNLKKKYEQVIKSFDLVMDIETLSKTEYTFNYSFEDSIYAKKIKIENEIFLNYLTDNKELNPDMLKQIIITKQKEFMLSLSIEEKKQLFIESLVLSYDRNVFNYFNKEKVLLESYSKRKSNLNELNTKYDVYKSFLISLENSNLLKMSLQEIYDEFKIIYETDFFKQKINKK